MVMFVVIIINIFKFLVSGVSTLRGVFSSRLKQGKYFYLQKRLKGRKRNKYREQPVGFWWVVGGWARRVMGIEEGTCWDEHWVLHVSDEPLNSTPDTMITVYVNYLGSKLQINKETTTTTNLEGHLQV